MTICNTFCTNKTSANFKDNQLWDCNFLCIKTGTLGSLSCLAWESAIVHSYIPDMKDIFIDMQHQEKGLVKYVRALTFIENQIGNICCGISY